MTPSTTSSFGRLNFPLFIVMRAYPALPGALAGRADGPGHHRDPLVRPPPRHVLSMAGTGAGAGGLPGRGAAREKLSSLLHHSDPFSRDSGRHRSRADDILRESRRYGMRPRRFVLDDVRGSRDLEALSYVARR